MIGSPPRVEVARDGVADDTWDEIGILVADELPAAGVPMLVRPERLLRQRRALRGALRRHSVGLSADASVSALLARAVGDDEALAAALDDRADAGLPVELDLGDRRLIRELRPFQIRDLQQLRNLRHGANFSVPGAGKTTVTYVLHADLLARGLVDRMLVVAPLSAFGAWEEDATLVVDPPLTIERWRGGALPESHIILVNYQRLPNGFEELSGWMARHRVHLVADEAHRAKRGAGGGWGAALLGLAPLAVRRDILTGTPAPNHPRDLVALMDITWPSGGASSAIPRAALRADPGLASMRAAHGVIRPLFARTNKAELELPPARIIPVHVPLGALQRDIYDAMLNRYAGMFDLDRRDGALLAQMGEVTMYLLQAASSPKLLSTTADAGRAYRYPPLAIPPGTRLASLIDEYANHEVPPKVARACAIVRDNAVAGRKTLVWSNFPDNLLDLEQQLAGMNPAVVYGAIPTVEDAAPGARNREAEIERFRNDPTCMVLLANPAALAEGVSLHQVCHDAVYIDRTFNAGQYLQSLDRIHRLGLPADTATTVTLLIVEDTIDERVNRRVEVKTARLAAMLADPVLVQMALPDDDDYGPAVDDPADLEEILAHLGERRENGVDD